VALDLRGHEGSDKPEAAYVDSSVWADARYNVSVPPWVRQALFSRALENDDVMRCVRKPVLLVHGAEDAIVDPCVVEQYQVVMPHASAVVMPNVGHVPFWEDAPTFIQSTPERVLRDALSKGSTVGGM